MKKLLLSLFSVVSIGFVSFADQCTASTTVYGVDDGTTVASISNFACVGPNTITNATLDGSGVLSFQTNFVDLEIWVNGVLVSTQNTNFTGFDLTPYLPLTSVAIKLIDQPSDGYPFDDVELTATVTMTFFPSCPQPTGFSIVTANSTSAVFNYTAGGAETSWFLEYGPIGFTPGTGTSVAVTGSPDTLTGLTPNSFYSVYVRANCGAGDYSNYTGPINFNTYNLGQFMEWSSDCPSGGFIDISATGSPTGLTDWGEYGVTLPFTFYYQGTLVSNLTIGNDGAVVLGTTSAQVYPSLPPNGSILGVYTQDMGDPFDNVYFQTVGTAPNRKFVIMWSDIDNYASTTDGATFELILDEATQNFYYVYDDLLMGDPDFDFGQDAEIGVRGPQQNINVSMNDNTYLKNNSCVKFYYTDCPKAKNFIVTSVTTDEMQIDWTSGGANEAEWTIVYGPTGFDPLTEGTTLSGLTTSDATISGLTQLTTYDIYIYSNCSASLTSFGYMNTVQTLPLCSIPTSVSGSALVDSIEVNWNFVPTPGYDATSFNIQYGPTGFNLYSGTTVSADITPNDTIVNPALLSGMIYDVYVQSVCGNDTSIYAGPFTVTMPLQNDIVCGAELLQVDGTLYFFNNTGATVESGESSIAPPITTQIGQNDSWASSGIYKSTWFKFVAPASGSVRVDFSYTDDIESKAAVYDVQNCSDFNAPNFTLISANDNGWQDSPNFTACGLIPGNEYYILHSNRSSWSPVGNYSIRLTPIVLEAGVPTTIINACLKDTVDLFTTISGQQSGGTWYWITPTAGLTDSLFNTDGSAAQIFKFQYRVVDGCAFDSVIGQVKVYAPSSAGNNGTIDVCKNQPLDLLSGLTGNVDHGGTWLNPSNQSISSSAIVASNIPGQFNYSYITGNGVCPNDTALVLVNVLSNCDYLAIEEMVFENMTVYPNPSTGILHIANSNGSDTFDVTITDANGRVVYSANEIVNGTKVTEINLEGKETGIYFVKVSNSSFQKTYRIVLQ